MKYCFYSLLTDSKEPKLFKGFSNSDNHGNFLLFPLELSIHFPIGAFMSGPTGVIRIYEKDCFTVDTNNMLRLYYK